MAKARCATCDREFGRIRYRFLHREFCSKRCLNLYLARRTEKPTSLKEWIALSRRR